MNKHKKINNQVAFKIRDRLTGLYALSGDKWSKIGKTWTNLGHLKNHLRLSNHGECPPNLEIVILMEIPNTLIPLSSIVNMSEQNLIELALQTTQWNVEINKK